MKTTMRKNTNYKFTLLAVFAGLLFTMSAQAATYTVTTTADTNDGVCDANCSLREAIAVANGTADNDIINFDASLAGQTITFTVANTELSITNNGTLTINGLGANQLTVSGGGGSRVFRVTGATATINNLTVMGGNGIGASSNFGGGILVHNSGTLTLNNSTVSGNSANNQGGGIYRNGGALTLNNSTVSGNSALNQGGGIYSFSTGITTLNNSTVSGNMTTAVNGVGGGIHNRTTTTTLNSSTVSNNTASSGGGIRNESDTLTLNNSIVANSTSSSECVLTAGTINAAYSLIEDNLMCVNGTNTNNLTGDPALGTLQNNGGSTFTHALLTGSIAIDKGNSALTTDQRGSTRPVDDPNSANGTGNLADIGAFEVQAPSAASVSVSGRLSVGKGAGLANAFVNLTDQDGNTRSVKTTSFGYYRFDDVEVGQSYTVTIRSRRYFFSPQVVSVNEEIEDLNFTAQ